MKRSLQIIAMAWLVRAITSVPRKRGDRALLVGIRRNQARIDGKAFTANQA